MAMHEPGPAPPPSKQSELLVQGAVIQSAYSTCIQYLAVSVAKECAR